MLTKTLKKILYGIRENRNPHSDITYKMLDEEFYKKEKWYYNNRHIRVNQLEDHMEIESLTDKVTYMSFLEKNHSYSFTINKAPKLNVNSENTIRVYGKIPTKMKVTIYVIEYNNLGERIKTNRLFINRETIITTNPNTKSVRLAVRILGRGRFSLNNIKIFDGQINKNLDTENTIKHKSLSEVKMACIFDEFSLESFASEVNLITFNTANWKRTLQRERPDVLMVESAWRGNNGAWEYQIGKYNNNNNNEKLRELISWCKWNNIPTVFWNKEDPVHFEKFIDAASLCDYIFTTDMDMIPKYKDVVMHNRVYSLQFAANPKKHNPIRLIKDKINKISFAGSYYANRHEDRRKDMDKMLNLASEYGLDIFDRNYERNKNSESHFRFPEHLSKDILGSLKYKDINKAYKNYRLVLNVNSVKYSPTMFSRRVFESLACGTPVVSSYSVGIKKTFNRIINVSEDESVIENEINTLMKNEKYYSEKSIEGMREVFSKHTYYHRLEYIFRKVGIPFEPRDLSVGVIAKVDSMEEFTNLLSTVEAQSFQNIKVYAFISQFEGYEKLMNLYNTENISVYLINYARKYNEISEIVNTAYLYVYDKNAQYGKFFIEDLVYASIYSNSDITGKNHLFDGENYNIHENEYQYASSIKPGSCIYKLKLLDNITLDNLLNDQQNLNLALFKERGARIFSSDKYNFMN